MTKRLKIFLIALLSTFLTISASVLLFPTLTFADSETATIEGHEDHDNESAHFKWHNGAQALLAYNEEETNGDDRYGLKFNFELTDLTHEDLTDGFFSDNENKNIESVPTGVFGVKNYEMYHQYNFRVFRVNSDTDATMLVDYALVFAYESDGSENAPTLCCFVLEKQASHYSEMIDIDMITDEIVGKESTINGWLPDESCDLIFGQASWLKRSDGAREYYDRIVSIYHDVKGLTFEDVQQANGNIAKMLSVCIYPESPFVEYFVEFRQIYSYLKGTFLFDNLYARFTHCADSDRRSVYGVLQNMSDAGDLENVFTEDTITQYINPIFENANTKSVNIEYLENIKGTPFAKKVKKTVDVSVLNQKITVDDVCAALDVKNLPVLDTFVYEFEFNEETEVYEAKYLKSHWLRSVTADGLYVDHFFDVSKSYQEYYTPLIEDNIFAQGSYEFVFTQQVLAKYPQLNGYKFDEVYGYFGVVITPKAITYNTLFKEVLNVDTNKKGYIEAFSFEHNLPFDHYNTLLNDYKYDWTTKLWSNIFNGFTGTSDSTVYIIYSTADTSFMDEGGGSGKGGNGGIIGGAIKDLGGWASDVLGGLWNVVAEPLRSEGTIRTVLIVAVVGVGVYLAFKYGLISIGGGKKRK